MDAVEDYRFRLREGRVTGEEIAIANSADKVKDWRSKPLALMENGLEYDVGKYLQLLDRAAMEILDGLVPEAASAKKKLALLVQTLELPLVWDLSERENLLRSKFES